MGKVMNWLRCHAPTRRRWIQLYAALLYNAHLKGFIQGEIYTGSLKNLCVPGLNCYSCPGAVGACPLGSLQNALAASTVRGPWYVLGILMLLGLTLGRTVCGFLCPMGLLQELIHRVPTPKIPKGKVTRVLSYGKYVTLGLLAVALPIYFGAQQLPLPAFCKYICPAGTLEGAVALLTHPENDSLFSMLHGLFTQKMVILILLAALCVFCYRAFCRFLCPLGAIYGFFARVSLLGIRVEEDKCTHCGLCLSRCPVDIRRVGDHECVHCGACKAVCPTGAISWKGSQVFLRQDAPKRRVPWQGLAVAGMLALLGVTLWVANQPGQEAAPPVEAVETGYQVGMTAPDFTVPLYGGGEFHLWENRGKVTVLNFWATWCTPCVAELPYFDRLAEEMGDQVNVLAIHSNLVTEDVAAWLEKAGYAHLPMALDESGEILASLGVSTMLPVTVILDAEGKVCYNAVGSVTYEFLLEQVQAIQ